MVLPGASDPVGVGWAQSLARPGGNVTGFTAFQLTMLGKSLEILKQIAPAVVRVALVYNPDNPNSVFYRRISEAASARLAIETVDHPIHGLADIDRAVASLADRGNSGIFFLSDITTTALRNDVVQLKHASENLATATTMYHEMDMGFFLERGEADIRAGQKSIGPSP